MRLTCTSKASGVGATRALAQELGQEALGSALDAPPLGQEVRVLGVLLQAHELLLGAGDPARADARADQARQVGVGQHHPAPGCHAVRDVEELRGLELVEVVQHVAHQEPRVQARRR
jgi:hypothetical protein